MNATPQPRLPQPSVPAAATVSPATAPASRRSAIPRRSWFRLQTAQPTYEQACRKVHAFAARHPALYRWRLRLFLPCVALVQVLGIALTCGLPLVFPWAFRGSELLAPIYSHQTLRWLFLAFVYTASVPLAGLYLAALFRGLTLALPEATGSTITEQDAPRLFRLLAETSRSLDIPPPARVVISPDRLLEARQLPARGLLDSAQTVLLAGLPLLEELSPQQFRAQLAHELAHLPTHNRRFGGRVLALLTRLRELRKAAESSALLRAFWSCQPDEALAGLLENLLQRLGPETLPAVRHHESEADAIAAAIAGREFAAAALIRRRLAGHALAQQFRQECMHQAQSTPRPPTELFDQRAAISSAAFSDSQVHAWLRHELELKDDLSDSHPPLWDRLRMLGYQLENLEDFQALMDCTRPHGPLGETAARYFLGEAAERFRAEFFQEWSARQEKDWRVRFEAYEKLRRTAADWPAGAADSATGPAALWQIAVAIGNTQSWRDARPVAQRILELDPLHGDANLLEGQLQLEEGDCAGLESLERAMAADSASIIPACQLAARFLDARNQAEAAARYRARAEDRRTAEQAIAGERAQVHATDSFCTADCSGDTAAALLRAVDRNSSHIRAAYLLRKRVAGEERRPLYVLGIERRLFPYQNVARANRLLLRRISEVPGLPGDIVICVITRANRGLLAKWNAVPGALFWSAALLSATGHSPARNTWEPSQTLPLLREQRPRAPLPVRHTTATAK